MLFLYIFPRQKKRNSKKTCIFAHPTYILYADYDAHHSQTTNAHIYLYTPIRYRYRPAAVYAHMGRQACHLFRGIDAFRQRQTGSLGIWRHRGKHHPTQRYHPMDRHTRQPGGRLRCLAVDSTYPRSPFPRGLRTGRLAATPRARA